MRPWRWGKTPLNDLETMIEGQAGHLSRDQALAHGLKPWRIETCVRDGTWVRVHPSVYRVATYEASWRGAVMAAILWAKGKAVISHQTAARLHGLSDFKGPLVELTGTAKLTGPGTVRYHEVRNLPRGDVTALDGTQVTSIERTMLDLCASANTPAGIPERYVERAFDEVLRDKLTSTGRLKWCLQDNVDRGRSTRLFRELREVREHYGVTDSPLESDFAYQVRKAGLAHPVRGHQIVYNYRLVAQVDFAWPAYRFCVQVHGAATHLQKKNWENDQRQENDLTHFGWNVLKVTHEQLKTASAWLMAQVGSQLLTPLQARGEAPPARPFVATPSPRAR
jgi:very-short-patch-repair endonuclease